jgi:hypothetical protein
MDGVRHPALSIGLTFGVISFIWFPLMVLAQGRCVPENLNASALRGDAAASNWLNYRNPKNGLSFRYPASMRVEELDPVPFHLDIVPEVIVDLKGDESNSPNITVMRFICARGQKTPEMAASKARALLKTHPSENPSGRVDDGAVGSMQVDGHQAIVSCGCGRAACDFSVLTLQPHECKFLPMVTGEGFRDNLPPPHDGEFPLLSIINTVHFEPATK